MSKFQVLYDTIKTLTTLGIGRNFNMAIIKCQECGKEISDQAKSCPNCGCPIKKEEKLNRLKLSRKCVAIVFFVIISCICLFVFVYRKMHTYKIEDYAVMMSVQDIKKNENSAIISECRAHYYNPKLESSIYNISDENISEGIIVYLNVKLKNEFGGMNDEAYLYTYDLLGNCIFYTSYTNHFNVGNDDLIWEYVNGAYNINWYNWINYTQDEILNLQGINVRKNIILKTPNTDISEKERDIILAKHIKYEISQNNYDLASDYASLISNEKVYEPLKEEIDNKYYNLGLEEMNNQEYENAIDYFEKCNEYKDSKNKVEECNFCLGKLQFEINDYNKALEYLDKAKNYNGTQDLVDTINQVIRSNELETQYHEAINNAEARKFSEAKEFFEKNVDYKDSQEYITLIEEAEDSPWNSYWISEDERIKKYGVFHHIVESHLRIWVGINSSKELTYLICDFDNWDGFNSINIVDNFPGEEWYKIADNQLEEKGGLGDRIVINEEELIYTRPQEISHDADGSRKIVKGIDIVFTKALGNEIE